MKREDMNPFLEAKEKERNRQTMMTKTGIGVLILSTLIAFTGLFVVAVIGWLVAIYCFWSGSIDKLGHL